LLRAPTVVIDWPPGLKTMRDWLGRNGATLTAAAILIAAVGAGRSWYYQRYPYGYSHCCIDLMSSTLEDYAAGHAGRYPAGVGCPEASLGLLHSSGYGLDAEILRGKTVPVETVRRILDRGGSLGPDTCGWHYVEGLTKNDDHRLAILWDKAGLGHNGERRPDGSREVALVGGEVRYVSGEEWPKFLEEQEQLLAARDALGLAGKPVLTASIRWPGGDVTDSYPGPFRLQHRGTGFIGASEGEHSGSSLDASVLKWWKNDLPEGEMTWVLVLPDRRMHSKPVRLSVHDHRPSQGEIVFDMLND
jgi:hypothetical protein